jgi:hypothetical protein
MRESSAVRIATTVRSQSATYKGRNEDTVPMRPVRISLQTAVGSLLVRVEIRENAADVGPPDSRVSTSPDLVVGGLLEIIVVHLGVLGQVVEDQVPRKSVSPFV